MKKLIIGIILALVLAATAVPVVAANGQKLLDHVVISPNPAPVLPGGTQLFTATSEDASNNPVTGVIYTWHVVAGGGTIVPNTGVFTAGTITDTYKDTIKVKATKDGVTKYAYADVIVANLGVVYSVVISPDTATIIPLGTQQYSAAVKDAFGNAVAITPIWIVSGVGNAIDVTGKVTASSTTGTFTVTATATQGIVSVSDTATVKIANHGDLDSVVISPETATVVVGGYQQFSATSKDAYDLVLTTGITYGWTVTGGGSIDGSGKFTATTAGTFTVTVTATQSVTNIQKTDTAIIKVVAEPEEHEGFVPYGWSHGKKNGWHGGNTPPGWSKGNKTGWDDEDSPPGLFKGQVDQDDEDEDED